MTSREEALSTLRRNVSRSEPGELLNRYAGALLDVLERHEPSPLSTGCRCGYFRTPCVDADAIIKAVLP
jgi:hypothetical protein